MKTNVRNMRQARARCHVSYIMNNETYFVFPKFDAGGDVKPVDQVCLALYALDIGEQARVVKYFVHV